MLENKGEFNKEAVSRLRAVGAYSHSKHGAEVAPRDTSWRPSRSRRRIEDIVTRAYGSEPCWGDLMKPVGKIPMESFNMRPGRCGVWQEPHPEHGGHWWFMDNYRQYLYDVTQIPCHAESYNPFDDNGVPRAPGIYFLLNGHDIVYVGKAKHIPERLRSHSKDKQFNRYWCFGGMPKWAAEFIEYFYIHLLQPYYNIKHEHLHEAFNGILDAWGVDTSTQHY